MANVPSIPGAYLLLLNGTVIYVGHTEDLARRYSEHQAEPHNSCIQQSGWDLFRWEATETVEGAKRLEAEWYKQFRPKCNLATPPATVVNRGYRL